MTADTLSHLVQLPSNTDFRFGNAGTLNFMVAASHWLEHLRKVLTGADPSETYHANFARGYSAFTRWGFEARYPVTPAGAAALIDDMERINFACGSGPRSFDPATRKYGALQHRPADAWLAALKVA